MSEVARFLHWVIHILLAVGLLLVSVSCVNLWKSHTKLQEDVFNLIKVLKEYFQSEESHIKQEELGRFGK